MLPSWPIFLFEEKRLSSSLSCLSMNECGVDRPGLAFHMRCCLGVFRIYVTEMAKKSVPGGAKTM